MECLYLGEKIEKTGLDIFSLNTHVGMGEGRLGGWAQRYEERFEFWNENMVHKSQTSVSFEKKVQNSVHSDLVQKETRYTLLLE